MLAYTAAQTTEIERVLKLTELHLSPRHSTRGGCFAPVSYADCASGRLLYARNGGEPLGMGENAARAARSGRLRFSGGKGAPQREGPLAGLRSDFWRRGEAQSHRRRPGCRPRQVSQIGPVGSLDVRAVGHRAEWVEFTPAQVGTATSNAKSERARRLTSPPSDRAPRPRSRETPGRRSGCARHHAPASLRAAAHPKP